ncbi:MAG: hypothetical protein D6682_07795 [Zetaproteobacteria bacterium]|nr:MAG: hypothetical protein D6682_07795 [Zetaproteobacteria bacterium]
MTRRWPTPSRREARTAGVAFWLLTLIMVLVVARVPLRQVVEPLLPAPTTGVALHPAVEGMQRAAPVEEERRTVRRAPPRRRQERSPRRAGATDAEGGGAPRHPEPAGPTVGDLIATLEQRPAAPRSTAHRTAARKPAPQATPRKPKAQRRASVVGAVPRVAGRRKRHAAAAERSAHAALARDVRWAAAGRRKRRRSSASGGVIYRLQMASFHDLASARALMRRLRRGGFDPILVRRGSWWAVRSHRYPDEASARRAAARLSRRFHLQVMVRHDR